MDLWQIKSILEAARSYEKAVAAAKPRPYPSTVTTVRATNRDLFSQVAGLEGSQSRKYVDRGLGGRPFALDQVVFQVGATAVTIVAPSRAATDAELADLGKRQHAYFARAA